MLKLERMHRQTGERFEDSTAMSEKMRLLKFATFNNLVLTNTLGHHKPSRRLTWHSPDGKHHNQIDHNVVKKRFRSGVNIQKARRFPGADIESDHDLVMMTFRVHLKQARKPKPAKTKV